MTPSERERRRKAAIAAVYNAAFTEGHRPSYVALACIALDAADDAVPMVPVRELEAVRQAGRIWLDRGEEMEKRAERSEAAARDLQGTASRVFDAADRIDSDEFADALIALGLALAAHPSFSGEEGTEG